jgi:hypothetical protein
MVLTTCKEQRFFVLSQRVLPRAYDPIDVNRTTNALEHLRSRPPQLEFTAKSRRCCVADQNGAISSRRADARRQVRDVSSRSVDPTGPDSALDLVRADQRLT